MEFGLLFVCLSSPLRLMLRCGYACCSASVGEDTSQKKFADPYSESFKCMSKNSVVPKTTEDNFFVLQLFKEDNITFWILSIGFCRLIISYFLSFSRTLKIFDIKMTYAISASTKIKSRLNLMVSSLWQ